MNGVSWAWIVFGMLWAGAATIAWSMVKGRRP